MEIQQQIRDNIKTVTLHELYGKEELNDLLTEADNNHVTNGFDLKLVKNEFLEGRLMKYNDDSISVSYQEWNLLKPFKLRVKHNSQLIKVQFEIEGYSHFESLEQDFIIIPSNHYQFIKIEHTDGFLTYNCPRKVLDIYIEPNELFKLLRTQGFSDLQLKEHFLLQNYTFCKKAIIINPKQMQLIHELLNHQYQAEFAKQFIRIKAMELMITVFSGATNSINHPKWNQKDIDQILEVKNFLDENFHQELTFKILTKKFAINEFKLKNAFKDLFGDTVFGYIRRNKLRKAHELLTNSNLEIKEIAFLTGFKYAHHFSKVYTEYYHIKPSEYRNQIKPKF